MKFYHLFLMMFFAILLGCERTLTQQKKLAFTYIHTTKERSKDSHESNHYYKLRGNRVKHRHQYTGRRKKDKTLSYKLSNQDIQDITVYLRKNNFYQNTSAKGNLKAFPGRFHHVEINFTIQGKTYKLSYAGAFRFGEYSKKKHMLHKKLLNFESFLQNILRK